METEKIETDVLEADEIEGADIKVNPDIYLHNALLKAQKALIKDNMHEGLVQFRMLVEHVEVIAKAANILTDDYSKELKTYMETDDYKKAGKEYIQSTRLGNKKLELILKDVFAAKVTISPLKA